MNGSLVWVRGSCEERVLAAAAALGELLGLSVGTTADESAPNPAVAAEVAVVASAYLGTERLREQFQAVPKPLLLVPSRRGVRVAWPIRRVVLPLDGSPEAANAVAEIAASCASEGVDLVVVHVFDARSAPRFWDQPTHAARSWSEEFLARQLDPATTARVELRSGSPGDCIPDVADAEGADLIVMGWSRNAGPGRARAVKETLAAAKMPILLIPLISSEHSPRTD